MVVQHNLRAMNSNRMLGLTASAQSKSTEKLSSGYKINRAADDAAGLSISEKMRKQIRGLSQASLNASDGISAVQTAEGALNEVQDMLQRMNELAVKASNGTNSEDDRNYIQDEIDQLIDEIDRVAETTKFNETYLLKGDKNGEKAIDFTYQSADVLKQDIVYIDGTDIKKAEKGEYINTLKTDVTYYSSGVEGEKVATAFTQVADLTGVLVGTTLIATDNLYMASGSDYVKVDEGAEVVTGATYYTVSFGTDGKVGTATEVTQPTTAAGYKVGTTKIYDVYGKEVASGTSLGTNPTTTAYFKAVGDGKFNPTDALANFDSVKETKTVQFMDKDGNEISENGLYQYFSETGEYEGGLYLQAGGKLEAASDKDVKALVKQNPAEIGALELNLHVGADAASNNQISLKIEAMSSKSLGVENVKVNGADDENALNAIETIKAAIQKVSTQRSALGAVQNRLEHTIANLDNVVENTTAAESQIRDTDMASEMVKYSNNNILAQAGQAMLAQANQSNQGVLSLLG